MRISIKTVSLIATVASLVCGPTLARTPDYPTSTYSGSTQDVISEGESVDRSVKAISAQADREMASMASDMQPRREPSVKTVSKMMERAQAYRDAGDMKNACRQATEALNMANRRGIDRNSALYTEISAQQAELCSASA